MGFLGFFGWVFLGGFLMPTLLSACGHPALWLSTNHIHYSLISLFILVHFSSLSHQLCLKLSRVAACLALLGIPFHLWTVHLSKEILSRTFSCESSNKGLRPSFLFHAHCPWSSGHHEQLMFCLVQELRYQSLILVVSPFQDSDSRPT